MKLGRLKDNAVAAVTDKGVINLSELGFTGNMKDLIKAGKAELEKISSLIKNADNFQNIDYSDFDAPIKDPSKIIAIGLNYVDHASESKMEIPKTPIVFTKFSNSITGPTE